jgi:hypothetical protein
MNIRTHHEEKEVNSIAEIIHRGMKDAKRRDDLGIFLRISESTFKRNSSRDPSSETSGH